MALSAEEKAQLEALTQKSKEPDPAPGNVNFSLDLSNDAAVKRAVKLGLFADPDAEPPPENKDDEDGGGEPPKRRTGYFPTS